VRAEASGRRDGTDARKIKGMHLKEHIAREGAVAFDDSLARDPRTDGEFWKIIEETFVQVEETLTGYPVETREEALEPQRFFPGVAIRYRGASAEYDSRDYFLKLGRKFVPRVKRQINSRQLSPKFAKDWGVVMMCHGFIAAHVLDDSDGLSRVRAGLQSGRSRSREPQRKWISHKLLALIDRGVDRDAAEQTVAKEVEQIRDRHPHSDRFPKSWFDVILTHGGLASTYDQKHLSVRRMRVLVTQPCDNIPPVDLPSNSSRG
jgi:hypothetical protein